MHLESLPPEIVAACLEELPLNSLIDVAYLSRHLCTIASDSALNPWRKPILHILHCVPLDDALWLPLKHLAVRRIVPRSNFIDILSLAPPQFLLFHFSLPNLSSVEWREAFHCRFLPSCARWHQEGSSWRQTFLKILFRIWHRTHSVCTADEAWTKYIVLNKNGSVNQLEAGSRNFNPFTIFNELKLQNNVMHLETHIRLLVEFADVRILAFGTRNRPRSDLTQNKNAHLLLSPPGLDAPHLKPFDTDQAAPSHPLPTPDHGVYPGQPWHDGEVEDRFPSYASDYTKLTRPLPARSFENYPFKTLSGCDARWQHPGDNQNPDLKWVGSMLIVTQLRLPSLISSTLAEDLIPDAARAQWSSFSWPDLWTIAPWMQDRIPSNMRVDGPGLGQG